MTSFLKSVFIREQKRYTRTQLVELFSLSYSEITSLIKKLKSYGVLKTVAKNNKQTEEIELFEDDIEIVDENESSKYLYVFTFVGVISIQGIVLKCYPKYIYREDNLIYKLKKVLKVIDKFKKKEQLINYQNDNLDNHFTKCT